MILSQQDTDSLNSVSSALNVDPQWLYNVINAESAWNPLAVSSMPTNQYRLSKGLDTVPEYARGLIQFIDPTAQSLGFKDSQDLIDQYPDISSQLLGPVYAYFAKQTPFTDENDFYLSVFYPAGRGKPLDTVLPDSVRASNPNIVTLQDYINNVKKNFVQEVIQTASQAVETIKSNPLIIIGFIAIIGFVILKNYKKV